MNNTDELLTTEAKIAKIKQLLPVHETRGHIFLPSDNFYWAPLNNTSLRDMARTICMWVGFKPLGLDVRFDKEALDDISVITQTNGRQAILIPERYSHNAYVCAGLLAQKLMSYYFQHRKHLNIEDFEQRETFITLSVVNGGLGILLLNSTSSAWQQRYPRLYARLMRSRPSYREKLAIADIFGQYVADYRIEPSVFSSYLCPWAELLRPRSWQNSHQAAGFVRAAREHSRRSYVKLAATLFIVLVGVIASGYAMTHRSKTLTQAQRMEQVRINNLKIEYERCNDEVRRKEIAFSDKKDYLIERTLEADRLRCVSLSNEYDYRVDEYNKNLSN